MGYYILFQRWMLLGKSPGCLCTPISFITEQFRALAGDLSYFPLEDEAYPPIELLVSGNDKLVINVYYVLNFFFFLNIEFRITFWIGI